MHHPKIDLHEVAAAGGVVLTDALEKLREIYAFVDEKNLRNTAGVALPCHRGCSDCCHESVFLTPLEFLGAWDFIQSTTDDETRSRIVARGLKIFEKERARISQFGKAPPTGERDHFSIARNLRFTCPLLDDDGACLAYPMREILARVFGCSWNDEEGGLYACHLVGRALDGQTVTLVRARNTAQMLNALPLTGMRQVYPWYINWLYGPRDDEGAAVVVVE